MSELVRSASYAASQELKHQGLTVGRSHLSETCAALLGYATYAALTQEALNPSVEFHLDRAQVIVLDLPSGKARAAALLPACTEERIAEVVAQCSSSLADNVSPVAVFDSVGDFFGNFAREEIAAMALEAEDLDPALRRVLGDPKADDRWTVSGHLWSSKHEWTIEARGTVQEAAGDGDELYGGVVLDWQGRLVFHKAGRAGLIVATGGATCQLRR